MRWGETGDKTEQVPAPEGFGAGMGSFELFQEQWGARGDYGEEEGPGQRASERFSFGVMVGYPQETGWRWVKAEVTVHLGESGFWREAP